MRCVYADIETSSLSLVEVVQRRGILFQVVGLIHPAMQALGYSWL